MKPSKVARKESVYPIPLQSSSIHVVIHFPTSSKQGSHCAFVSQQILICLFATHLLYFAVYLCYHHSIRVINMIRPNSDCRVYIIMCHKISEQKESKKRKMSASVPATFKTNGQANPETTRRLDTTVMGSIEKLRQIEAPEGHSRVGSSIKMHCPHICVYMLVIHIRYCSVHTPFTDYFYCSQGMSTLQS